MSARRSRPGIAGATAALAALLAGSSARAASPDDGAYGRLDGDLDLSAGAGAAFAAGGPALTAETRALYLSTAGVYAQYCDALGAELPPIARSIAAGVAVRPLFLARLGQDAELGSARLDLLIDSLGLEVGAFWAAPRGGATFREPGLDVGLSLSIPLVQQAAGPFLGLRAALRWRKEDLEGRGQGDVIDRGAMLTITLAYREIVNAHIADAFDGAPR